MTETLAHGYSSESTQLELSKMTGPRWACALDIRILSIRRVKEFLVLFVACHYGHGLYIL